MEITKKVTSYEAACKLLKINPKTLPIVKGLDKDSARRIIAFHKLSTIAKALNEGWKPNWKDVDEWKYYPYFYYNKNSFVFSHVDDHSDYSGFASALYYKNSELAQYAGKKFKKLYNDYLK